MSEKNDGFDPRDPLIEGDLSRTRAGSDRIDREDKIFLAVIGTVLAVAFVLFMVALRWILATVFGMFADVDSGIGLRAAFLTGTGLSLITVLLFALVGGDGVVGELPTMIAGFFIMVIFFTGAIAIIF